MGWFRDFVYKLLKIRPATERRITITEPLTFRANVLQNKLWYRGDPSELTQFFRQTAAHDTDTARFWASVPFGKVRKIHSGIVSIVVDRYKDIVTADLDSIDFGEGDDVHPIADTWQEIAKDCDFNGVLGDAIAGALSSADGAWKISIDQDSPFPIAARQQPSNFTHHTGKTKKNTDSKRNTAWDMSVIACSARTEKRLSSQRSPRLPA